MVLRIGRAVRALAALATVILLCSSTAGAGPAGAAEFKVPVEYYKLPNGLRVVLSPDHTSPTICVGVYYRIGFRVEPRDRTGFAHLFEHMMFQGSQNLGKMEFIKLVQQNGGILNGSTRFDFTNYFEVLPANKLETALWAEADRMGGLAVNEDNLKNQQGVVGNEVKVNVLNRPYGGFPWIDMPMAANTNWFNAHNFYGDLKDIDAATLTDVQAFFKTYYAPNNAALAKRPAIAVGYHMPERNTPEYYAMAAIDSILIEGDDSLLHQELVQKRGMTGSVNAGINLLGNAYDYNGPMLFITNFVYAPSTNADAILQAMDGVIEPLRSKPVDQKSLDRALVKLRSDLYDTIGGQGGFGLVDLLASFALFDDNPVRVNSLVSEFGKVTPALIQKTAEEYLRPGNRTVSVLNPQTQAPAAAPAAPAKNQ